MPLTAEWVSSIESLTFDEALRGGTATVSEISDSGSVPDLKFTDDGDQSVFLELAGTRMLVLSWDWCGSNYQRFQGSPIYRAKISSVSGLFFRGDTTE